MITQSIFRIIHLLAVSARYVTLIGALACASLPTLSENAFASGEQASADESAGWNLFSVEQDIQLGNESAIRFEAAVQLAQDARLNDYFSRLGNHLVSTLPQAHFPFRFKLIADESLEAFSFPGGPVYCTTGMMAAAETEAQLAGLVAHQIAHIILRDVTSIASRIKRFRVRAAMAAAATGKKSLLESLEEINLYLVPGSELMHFDIESERRATELAANLMAEAGYPPLAAWTFSQNLHIDNKHQADSYLARHPSLDLGDTEVTQDLKGKSFQLTSKRKFKRMRKQAAVIRTENEHLEALVNWQPPDQEPVAPVYPREIYLTGSYSFSYPAAWRQAYSSGSDKVQFTPKGSAGRLANGESVVTVGVIAGTTNPEKQFRPGKDNLLEMVKEIRPGLTAIRKLETISADSRSLEGMALNGPSPVSGEREMVWIVSTRLADRVFYLLMIAPEIKFIQMEPEFNAILASIKFYEHPDNGHMDERSQEGTVIRPHQ